MKKWLKRILSCMLCVMTMFGTLTACGEKDDGLYTVTFDLCTDLETTKLYPEEDVEKGETITQPRVSVRGENPNNSEIEGWYLDKEYTKPWNFFTDVVVKDMTLYAKWINKYSVEYYLGSELETPMHVDLVKEGQMIQVRQDLSAGFKSNGFFADPDHTIPFVPTAISEHTKIYIHRSDEFFFDAKFIAERFTPVAASSGLDGSTPGNIELVGEGEDAYAKVNFGYSKIADPHMLLQMVTVDISKSQKIQFVMKNVGPAEKMKIFFVSWYDPENKDGNDGYVGSNVGIEASKNQSFGEDRSYVYEFDKETQVNMTAEDEWAVIEIDLASLIIKNGISMWGESSTLLKLRIDSCYTSKNEEDDSNEFWIKSISGIKDENYKPLDDSNEVKGLLGNDTDAELKAASSQQADVLGWVFPKDRKYVAADEVTDVNARVLQAYDKEEGLLLYTPFRTPTSAIRLDLDPDEKINLDDYGTLRLRLKNYGYANKITLNWANKMGGYSNKALPIGSAMTDFVDYEFNMANEDAWEDMLETLTIEYTAIGVNNAVIIERIEFLPYEPASVAGVNFNNKKLADKQSSSALEISYIKEDSATRFNVKDTVNAVFESTYTKLPNIGYKDIQLTYKQATEGITKVNVGVTVDGEECQYAFAVGVTEGSNFATLKLPLTKTGNVTKIKVTFEGAGEIVLESILFKADADFSAEFDTTELYERILKVNWSSTMSYESGLAAVALGPCTHINPMKYYFGNMKQNKDIGNGNIPLAGKTKFVVIYHNPGTVARLSFALGFVDVTEGDGWKTAHCEAGNTGGSANVLLETNMAKGEWAVAVFDLAKFNNTTNAEEELDVSKKAWGTFYINHHFEEGLGEVASTDSVYIRLIAVI